MSIEHRNVGPLGRRWVANCDRCKRPLGHHPLRALATAALKDHMAAVHGTYGGDPNAA